jgi:hypothetical protein
VFKSNKSSGLKVCQAFVARRHLYSNTICNTCNLASNTSAPCPANSFVSFVYISNILNLLARKSSDAAREARLPE